MLGAHEGLAERHLGGGVEELLGVVQAVGGKLPFDFCELIGLRLEVLDEVGLARLLRDLPRDGLEHLPDVHASRDAARVERHLDVVAVLGVGHLLVGKNEAHDALVAVSA